jgi:PTH1 family peptidyl-tRNA hydrolase
MSYIIVGLGNPDEEYGGTRHNVGRMVLDYTLKKTALGEDATEWKLDKKLGALVAKGKLGKESLIFLKPEIFMNNSGKSVKPLVTSIKKAHNLIVIHDDLDLPLGSFKVCFNRGSGGHKGVESIARAIKTKEFIRVKVGVSPATASGKIRKPVGEEKVIDFIIGKFKPAELEVFKKVEKKASVLIEAIICDGLEKAMSQAKK